jgi:hypothetical protein
MKRIILTKNGNDILGSDGLMYIDGRLCLYNIKSKVRERNTKFSKNFPHKIADGFYIAGERLQKVGQIINL